MAVSQEKLFIYSRQLQYALPKNIPITPPIHFHADRVVFAKGSPDTKERKIITSRL